MRLSRHRVLIGALIVFVVFAGCSSNASLDGETYEDVTILDASVDQTAEGLTVTVTARNDGAETIRAPVAVDFLDDRGAALESKHQSVTRLAPGDSVTMRFSAPPNVAEDAIDDVSVYVVTETMCEDRSLSWC